jgi:hypothetical protein
MAKKSPYRNPSQYMSQNGKYHEIPQFMTILRLEIELYTMGFGRSKFSDPVDPAQSTDC